jgi:hypothetical protein
VGEAVRAEQLVEGVDAARSKHLLDVVGPSFVLRGSSGSGTALTTRGSILTGVGSWSVDEERMSRALRTGSASWSIEQVAVSRLHRPA